MKKQMKYYSAFTLLLVFAITSCAPGSAKKTDGKEYTYTSDLPAQIITTDTDDETIYSARIADYGESYSKIATGFMPDEMDTVYTAEGAIILKISANENHIAWFERINSEDSTQHYNLKVYTHSTKKTATVFENEMKADEERIQDVNIGLVGDTLYYLQHDFEQSVSKIMAKDLNSDKEEVFVEHPFTQDEFLLNIPITFLTVRDSMIICSNKKDDTVSLEAYRADTSELEQSVTLPDYVALTYSADYDQEEDAFALYFQKSEESPYGWGDGVGVIKGGEKEVKEIYTLDNATALYKDKIGINDGMVYYVEQWNTSGNVVDHYKGILYDYENDQPQEIPCCYDIERHNQDLSGMFFDPKSTPTEKVIYKSITEKGGQKNVGTIRS